MWGGLNFRVNFMDIKWKNPGCKVIDNGFALVSGLWEFLMTHLPFAKEKDHCYLLCYFSPTVAVRLVCSLKETLTKGGWFIELFTVIPSVKSIFHPDFQTLHGGRTGSSPELLTRYLFSHSPPVACFFVVLLVFLPSEWQGQHGACGGCNKCCCAEPTGKLDSPRPAITV